jgi:hypothetical protein
MEIGLNSRELFDTKTVKGINMICMCICLFTMLVGAIFPALAGRSGFLYCAIPFAYTLWFSHRGKKGRKLFSDETLA